ncbi:capsule assembly Wzi family protein [Spirosoma sp. KNUC1025]|uniref:capsule assembly Wzi family protein n=1 Tax=Spirosoma sp. KNUC1025 TaxID=2894082 RepID=UPI00386C48DF|nr:capsule assembly Wzi family protein [Spirosoma sp. KNUC1025]
MKQFFLFTTLLLNWYFPAWAQTKSQHQVFVEVGGLVSSADRTPFWLRANQFGVVPFSGSAGTLRVGTAGAVLLTDTAGLYARKSPGRAWVLSYAAEAVGNAGTESQLLVPEYYVKLSHRQIEFVAGRRREVVGLVDTALTSGSYSWSGNALPIPKLRFGTKGFAPIGRRKWLAINAFIAHGWFANTDYMQRSYLHQKSLIVRIGKPKAAAHFFVGINHSVQWAGHSDSLDYHYAVDGQLPNQLRDFPNVLFAIRTDGLNNPRVTSFDYTNLYGNHLGSIDFGFNLQLPAATLFLYHQHGFEDSSGMFFKNVPDGLSGIRIQPVRRSTSGFHVDDFLIEFLNTLNQSGPIYDPYNHIFGADNYFNNQQYREGWTYKNRVIGTSFITQKKDVKPENQTNSHWTVNNNRVQVAHVGMQATVAHRMKVTAKISYSLNYGVPQEPLPGTPKQWSSLVQVGVPVSWLGGALVTASAAADFGQLYSNAVGTYISLRKTVW